MAVFTAVSDPQLTDWLQNYELGEVTDFRGIASGIENSNFFLTTTRGAYVLTLFENLTATQSDAASGVTCGARSGPHAASRWRVVWHA